MSPATLFLFGGCNGAGKTTFARAFLQRLPGPPRFLNADEIARGLSPLNPSAVALKAGKLLLSEIEACLTSGRSFGLESTLSGMAQIAILDRARELGFSIQIHFLWLPSASLSIRRVAQRVRKGGHFIPSADIRRRYVRSLENFVAHYGPMADSWMVWDNRNQPAILRFRSGKHALQKVSDMSPTIEAGSRRGRIDAELAGMEEEIELGMAASKKMARDLRAEHKRWNMPLLTWKDGKVVAVKP